MHTEWIGRADEGVPMESWLGPDGRLRTDWEHDETGHCIDSRCPDRGMEHGHRATAGIPRRPFRCDQTLAEELADLRLSVVATREARAIERALVWVLEGLTRAIDWATAWVRNFNRGGER